MDPSNCSQQYVTDFVFDKPPKGSCETAWVPLITVCLLTILLRFLALASKWEFYFSRKRKGLKHSIFRPLLLTFPGVGYLVLFILAVYMNIINVFNGFSFLLYALMYLPFGINLILVLVRLVRMGGAIIKIRDPTSSIEYLQRFDQVLKIIILFAILCFTSAIVLGCTVVFLPDQYILLQQLSFGLIASFQVLISSGVIWQLQRCRNYVKENLGNGNMVIPIASETLRKLYLHQLNNAFFGIGLSFFFLLLATRVLPWSFYTFAIIIGLGETLSILFQEFVRRFSYLLDEKQGRHRILSRRVKKGMNPAVARLQGEQLQQVEGGGDFAWSSVYIHHPQQREDNNVASAAIVDETEPATTVLSTHIDNHTLQVGHETIYFYLFGERTSIQMMELSRNIFFVIGIVAFGICSMAIGLGVMDICEFDERVLPITVFFWLMTIAILGDSFVSQSGRMRKIVYFLSFSLSLTIYLCLQFDVLTVRRNTVLKIFHVGDFEYAWSVYQLGLDGVFSLTALFLADMIRIVFSNENYFLLLTKPIYVRIIPSNYLQKLRKEKQPLEMINPTENMKSKYGGLVLANSTVHLDSTHRIEFLEQIYLREDDALVFRILGQYFGSIYITKIIPNLYYRASMKFLGTSLITILFLVASGILPTELSWISFLLIIPSFASMSLKSLKMMKTILYQFDFFIDFLIVSLSLTALGFVFSDERIIMCVFIGYSWFDGRMNDARVVFFHSKTRGGNTGTCNSLGWYLNRFFTVTLICAYLGIPIFFSLGAVSNRNPNAFIYFGPTNGTTDISASLAKLQLLQFAANGLAACSIYNAISFFVQGITRKKGDAVTLTFTATPILKEYVVHSSHSKKQNMSNTDDDNKNVNQQTMEPQFSVTASSNQVMSVSVAEKDTGS